MNSTNPPNKPSVNTGACEVLADGLVSSSFVPYFYVLCILRQSSVLLRHIAVFYIIFLKIQSCHFEIYCLVLCIFLTQIYQESMRS